MPDDSDSLEKLGEKFALDHDTDILVFIGGITTVAARNLVDIVRSRRRRKNVLFVLGTNGGDGNAAYKIGRCLQHGYESGDFTVAIYGECKSAGTLVAIAAKSIVMCQHGELGPLDVQMSKEDQLFTRSSGLTPKQALESLKNESFSQFEHFLMEIHERSGYQISTRLASSIAIKLVVGLLSPIYSQMDPMRIGETQRAMEVARVYGNRLNIYANLKRDALATLVEGYPSHDFAIDLDEAKKLFNRISETDDIQMRMGRQMAHLLLDYQRISSREPILVYLNPELKQEEKTKNASERTENEDARKDSNDGTGKGESSAGASNGGGAETADTSRKRGAKTTVQAPRNSAEPVVQNGVR